MITNKHYKHPNAEFSQYLYNAYSKIPMYATTSSSTFLPYADDCVDILEVAKKQLPASSKTVNISYTKIFKNEAVSFVDGNFIKVIFEKSKDFNTTHKINTGLAFQIPEKMTLCIYIPLSEKSKKMTPILLDSQVTMPLILNIDATQDVTECILQVVLFSNSSKCMVNGQPPNLLEGTVKNLVTKKELVAENNSLLSCESITKVDDKKKTCDIKIYKKTFTLFPATALIFVPRKRYQKAKPATGVFIPKNSDNLISSFPENQVENVEIYSFSIFQGVYQHNFVVDEDLEFKYANGGYNGWIKNVDLDYDNVVKLYKSNVFVEKSMDQLQTLLNQYNIPVNEDDVEKLRNSFDKTSVKLLRKYNLIELETCKTIEEVIEKFGNKSTGVSFSKIIDENTKTLNGIIAKRSKEEHELDKVDKIDEKIDYKEKGSLIDSEAEEVDEDEDEEELDAEEEELDAEEEHAEEELDAEEEELDVDVEDIFDDDDDEDIEINYNKKTENDEKVNDEDFYDKKPIEKENKQKRSLSQDADLSNSPKRFRKME